MIVFWLGQDLGDLAQLGERRGAEADRLVEAARVAGERGAELVDEQRQPLAERLAQRVLDEVVLDRLRDVLAGMSGLGSSASSSSGSAARPARRR